MLSNGHANQSDARAGGQYLTIMYSQYGRKVCKYDSLVYQAARVPLNSVQTCNVFPILHGPSSPANTYVRLQNVLNKWRTHFQLVDTGPPPLRVCYLKTPRDIHLGNADIVGYGNCKTNKYTCLSVKENCDWKQNKISGNARVAVLNLKYKVVQIWPGQTVACLHKNRLGHIWNTLYMKPHQDILEVHFMHC